MTFDRKQYIKEAHVKGFIQFLADAMAGKIEVNHSYVDRFLRKRKHPDQVRNFRTLEDAFDAYYWPEPDDNLFTNFVILDPLKDELREARDTSDDGDVYVAISSILWWGAGNRKTRLYSSNTDWLVEVILDGTDASEYLDKVDAAFDCDPFVPDVFDGKSLRSNAGFTKVHALMRDNFVIYDSRVAAAIGLLIVQYCQRPEVSLKQIPNVLKIGWSAAAGGDNRNPSTGDFKFPTCYNHKIHAASNWRANIFLSEALALLELEKRVPGWLVNYDELRFVEAALFMLGKHIPLDDE